MMLPIGDLDDVRVALNLTEIVKKDGGSKTGLDLIEIFFLYALRPYYDCIWDGMTKESCAVLYSLAKLVPEDMAKNLQIYPKGEKEWIMLSDFIQEVEEDKSMVVLEVPKALQERFERFL